MKSFRILAMSTLSALMAAGAMTARADTPPKVYINPFIGYQLFDHKRGIDDSATYGAGLEYRFRDAWSLEGVFSHAEPDYKKGKGSGSSSFNEYRLDALHYFTPDQALQPYLATGVGHANFTRTHGETRVNAGGGLRYALTPAFSLRADAREFYGMDDDTWDTMLSVGVSWGFGGRSQPVSQTMETAPAMPVDSDKDGVPDSQDQCPGTPAGTAVNSQGCPVDSDKDGVPDAQDKCPGTAAGVIVNSQGCPVDSDGDGVPDNLDKCPNTAKGVKVDSNGCEGKKAVVKTIRMNIQFPTNSAKVPAQYDQEIGKLAAFMKAYEDTDVEIGGHTDNTGNAAYNKQLSQRRADAVRQELIHKYGIKPSRITAIGYGEAQPVASNKTAAGRMQNRRVEARIQKEVQ